MEARDQGTESFESGVVPLDSPEERLHLGNYEAGSTGSCILEESKRRFVDAAPVDLERDVRVPYVRVSLVSVKIQWVETWTTIMFAQSPEKRPESRDLDANCPIESFVPDW